MKKLLLFFCFCYSFSLLGQEWVGDYDKVVALAKTEDKPIVLVFSGSDWCAPCIKLNNNIWKSEDFISYSSEHYILYKADFPRKKTNKLPEEKIKSNQLLAEKYNPRGYFPLVVILNKNEEVMGTTGYAKVSPKQYISRINSFIE